MAAPPPPPARLFPRPWDAPPALPAGTRTITEGGAVVQYPGAEAVFYNRVQILNRDLTMCVARVYDARRRAAATPRDAHKAWLRRRILERVHGGAGGAPTPPPEPASATLMVPVPPWQVGNRALTLAVASASDGGAAVDAAAGGAPDAPAPVPAAAAGAAAASSSATAASGPPPMPGLRVLEALSASGLRAIRYCREVPGVDHVVANDVDAAAAATIRANAALSGLSERSLQPSRCDAALLLALCTEPHYAFDVLDLDPYGTAAPFLDGAVQAVADGGLLAVTCTDMACLAGPNAQDACAAKYGGLPVRGRFGHEQALRLVLATIDAASNRHHRAITPLLCLSVDFYVRLFVRVDADTAAVNTAPLRTGAVLHCASCDSHWTWVRGKRRPARGGGGGGAVAAASRGAQGSGAGSAAGAGGKRPRSAAAADDDGGADDDGDDDAVDSDDGSAPAAAAVPAAIATTGDGIVAGALPAPPARPAPGRRRRGRADGAARPAGKVHAATAPPGLAAGGACPHCGGAVSVGGPLWLGRLHDPDFAAAVAADAAAHFGEDGRGVPGAATGTPARYYDMSVAGPAHDGDAGSNDVATVAASRRRLLGLLRAADEELPDAPLYVEPSALCSRAGTRAVPSSLFAAALRNAGFRTSCTHASAGAVKTDAPPSAWWPVVRAWEAQAGNAAAPARRAATGGVPHALLVAAVAPGAPPDAPVDFTVRGGGGSDVHGDRKHAGPRFLSNPGAQWGPLARASDERGAAAAARRAAVDVASAAVAATGNGDGAGDAVPTVV